MRSPSNHVCLGLRLERLSLGHVFLLSDIESPFLQGGSVSVVDLSNAVFICSQPWRQAAVDSRRWWFRLFEKLWAFRCRNANLETEQDKFAAYFKEESDFPIAKGGLFKEREFGAPWQWRLLAIMMSEFNLSEDDALDMPVIKAALLFSAKAEYDGKLQLWTERDSSFDEFCRKMDGEAVEFPPASN